MAREHEYIYASAFPDLVFIWRPLTRMEYYRLAAKASKGEDVAYEVCRLAVLFPQDVDYQSLPGGVATRLADDIWRQSAAPSTERLTSLLGQFRQLMENFERQAECTIATAFPQFRFEEMANWPYIKLIDYVARAEWALNHIHKLPVQFARLDAEKNNETKPDPAKLRAKGIDPMMLLDPARLRPNMVHDLFIVGTSGWRAYNCSFKPKKDAGKQEKGAGKPRNAKPSVKWVIEHQE